MNWLVLVFAFQLGYTPNTTMVMYQPPPRIARAMEQGLIDFDVEARLFNELLYVGGNIGVPVWNAGQFSFWPSELQSEIRAGIRPVKGIEIGWSHLCTHPVVPYLPGSGTQILWEGWSDEFHVKLSGTVKLF